MVLVIADDPYGAVDLAELVDAQYELLKPVHNIDDALRNESPAFEELGAIIVQSQVIEYGQMPNGPRAGTRPILVEGFWEPIETFAAIVYPKDNGVAIMPNLQR